ncbi:hypothetical protein HC928_03810 [bacterium]|nr:hypothetical protein [bacterium]
MSTGTLSIYKSIPNVPGDTAPAEAGVDVLPLIVTGGTSVGFSVKPGGWIPGRAALKGGGSWADSATLPGRRLLSAEPGNVTETLQLVLSAGDWTTYNRYLSRMALWLREAERFQTSPYEQLQPVYLGWKPQGATYEQYALIVAGSLADVLPRDGVEPLADVTLTLEREPYWRVAVPPGATPMIYSAFTKDNPDYTFDDVSLIGPSALHWSVNASQPFKRVQNRTEWSAATDLFSRPSISHSFLDLPSVPGDAPALTCIGVRFVGTNEAGANEGDFLAKRIYIARASKRKSHPNRLGVPASLGGETPTFINLNGADAGTITPQVVGSAAVVSDATNGVRGAGTATTQAFRVTTGRYAVRFNNSGGANPTSRIFDVNTFRGRWQVFARVYQFNSGDAGKIRFKVTEVGNADAYASDDVTVTCPTTKATGFVQVVDLGQMTLPLRNRARQYQRAGGLLIVPNDDTLLPNPSLDGTLEFSLEIEAVTGSFSLIDVVLLPYDEQLVRIDVGDNSRFATSTGCFFVVDSTGYMSRVDGTPHVSAYRDTDGTPISAELEYRGPALTLEASADTPDGRNRPRLYFFVETDNAASGIVDAESNAKAEFRVTVDIVPRVVGAADF